MPTSAVNLHQSRDNLNGKLAARLSNATDKGQANFPNLRRLFIEARTDNEERDVSRRAVGFTLAFHSRTLTT